MSRRHPRIMLYSHDTYGLGHLRRTLAIAGQVAEVLPNARQLLITGSLVAGAFQLPPHLDLVKLPALSKRGDGRYKPRVLPLSLAQTMAWREQMIVQAAQAFQPDLLLVDKTPAGVQGELLPALRHLKTWQPSARLVLGMRDIEDEPAATLADWQSSGARRLHEEVYDAILLYGEREVFDPVQAYAMSAAAARKLVPCGYLGGAVPARPAEPVRRELGAGDRPLIVVTVGGGGDGFALLKAYSDMLAAGRGPAGAHHLLVTGPLMARSKRDLLRGASRGGDVTVLEFTPDLLSYLAAADLVVSMAGYNSVREILALGRRALFIPRVRPRAEQRIRAEAFAARGLAHVLLPDDLDPSRLAASVCAALAAPAPGATLRFDGLERVGAAIRNMLAGDSR